MASDVPLIARHPESIELDNFLRNLPHGFRCLLLEGEVGIGKTVLLHAARERATALGYVVLSASPVEMEVPWEFSALADLLEAVPQPLIEQLPEPQRRAIHIAVFRDLVTGEPVDPRTLATAVLHVVHDLCQDAPVVLAIDDLAWVDASSGRVLSYVLRRARNASFGLVGAVRSEWSRSSVPLVTDSVDPSHMAKIDVGPLSLHETGELLARRMGHVLGRSELARLYELSRGNPLFALELVDDGGQLGTQVSGSPDVPRSLRRLVQHHVQPLGPGARDLLLLAALGGDPTEAVVLAAAAHQRSSLRDLDLAIDSGLVQRRNDAVTFSHPLIRSVVAAEATAEQSRDAHRRLASAVVHPELRARHLALSTDGPDEAVARAVEDASASAALRGACETAAALAALATSVTPPGRTEDRHRRMVIEAEHRFESSESARACSLLETVIAEMPAGPGRASCLHRLARYLAYRGDPYPLWIDRLTAAWDESGEDLELRCAIATDLAQAVSATGDPVASEAALGVALELAAQTGDAARMAVLEAGAAFIRFSRGEGFGNDLRELGLCGPEQPVRLSMELRPAVAIAHVLHLSGDLDGARELYEREYQRALAEGVETGLPLLLWGLVETELWAGNWERAESLCAEGTELADDAGNVAHMVLMSAVRGIVNVQRGRIAEGVRDGQTVMTQGLEVGVPMVILVGAQALGLSGLSVGDPAATHERLAPVMAMVQAAGVTEPGFLHFVPDEVEALIRLGELDAAGDVLSPFEASSGAFARLWGIAAAGRCRALLLAARGDLGAAETTIAGALKVHDQVPMPFERARTLLVAGEIHRRARRKRRSRDALEAAAAIFAQLGAPNWEHRTGEELGRLGLRSTPGPAAGAELTEVERRVADLVAAGLTNPEVAAQLFMAQRTVEYHLTKVYRKVGVRSRTELARSYGPSSA